MRLLLDTHVLIWALASPKAIAAPARAAIIDGGNEVFVSAVTVWEIEIKKALGKLSAPDDLVEELQRHRFAGLPMTIAHALEVGRLPAHHQDPFDRLLVAQAAVEDLTLVTRDKHIQKYDVACLLA